MKTKPRNFSVEQLLRRVSCIDLNPFFQREKIWPISYQQYFIDTIIKGWGTPKIYLAIKGDQDEESYICIDGKQRLNAIFSFLRKGGFKLSSKYSKDFSDKSYSDLPQRIQDKINQYKITIEQVYDYTDQELGELFKRLQHGRSLNSAEKLKANNTKITKFIDYLTKHKFFTNRVSLSNTRYAHFAVAAQLCLLEVSGRIVNAKYNNLEKFLNNYANFDNQGLEAKQIKNILDYLTRMFKTKSPEISNRGSIVSIFLLISELMKRGNIRGKEKLLFRFFKGFTADLKKAIITTRATKSDLSLIKYHNATIQAADSLTSIKIRHETLIEKLVNYAPIFKKLLNISTDEEKFKNLYDKLEKKHGGSPKKFNTWLQTKYSNIKKINCKQGVETIPVHVRHSIHHSEHPRYKKTELIYSLEFLRNVD